MVLRYFNHDVWPDTLNDWLSNETDGYIGPGYLNWIAVSRYTLEKQGSPVILEFKRHSGISSVLANEIESLRPAIVQVPGHYVVVKGLDNQEFIVSDPLGLATTLLEIETLFGGQFSSINSYTPSTTDLSYILITSQSNLSFKLYTYSSILVEESFIENGIKNSSTDQEVFEPLSVLMESKPSDLKYYLELNTQDESGNYPVTIYLYDQDGKLFNEEYYKKSVFLAPETPMLMTLSYTKEDQPITVSYDSLLKNLEFLMLSGKISKYDVYIGLRDKIVAAKFLNEVGKKTKTQTNILRAFDNQIKAQKGKAVDENSYEILLHSLNDLIQNI